MIGDKIKAALEAKHRWRGRETWLARQVGVSRQTVNYWIRGEKTPSLANLTKAAAVLGVKLDELAGED